MMLQAPDRRRNPDGVATAIVSKAPVRRGSVPAKYQKNLLTNGMDLVDINKPPRPQQQTDFAVKETAATGPSSYLQQTGPATAAPTTDNPYFKFAPAGEDRGFGVFATRDIPQGTRILTEVPQLVVNLEAFSRSEIRLALENTTFSSCIPAALAVQSAIHNSFKAMTAADQAKVLELHCHHKTGDWKQDIVAIVKANGFDHGVNGAAICAEASRFNHACVCNAHFGWNSIIGSQTFHIIKEGGVRTGDEITVCYDKPEAERESRQRHLRESYGFVCTCEVCDKDSARGKLSSRRRAEMAICNKKISEFDAHPAEAALIYGGSDPLNSVNKMLTLLVAEGLVGLVLARMLHRASVLLKAKGQGRKARELAEREVGVYIYCIGTEHPRTGEAKEWYTSL